MNLGRNNMVEWKKLGDLTKIQRGKRLTKNLLIEGAPYPVYHGGVEPLGCYDKYNREENTVMVINVGASAGSVGFSHQKFWSSDGCFCISQTKYLNSKFLYSFLLGKVKYLQSQVRHAGIPTLDSSAIEKIAVPIPPLSEQNRIVGILDTFSESIENLKKQISERKKQYEHYRDQLLELEGKPGVEMKNLGEVLISLKTGLNPRKNFVLNSPNSKNYYITVRELGLFDVRPTDKTDKVTDEALQLINNRANLESGDVLFSGTGTIGRTALVKEKPKNWNIKEGVYTLKPRKDVISSRYLIELLHSNIILKKIDALVVGDPIRSIPMKSLVLIPVPIPSLTEQKRIVSILDTFEASSTNLEQQLSLRQKQYEFYRNKLLSFE